jgi:flavin reductase (DIM6/NTAB) family NADH-FMN oxidoreductase RutF
MYKLHPVESGENDSYKILFKSNSQTIDVTKNIVLISLDKPTFAIPVGYSIKIDDNSSLDILKNNISKAKLKLKKLNFDKFNIDNSISFFEVTSSSIAGRKLNKWTDILFLHLKNLTDRKSNNLKVSATSLVSLFAFYIVPLPVYSLCIGSESEADIFPDDIAGSIQPGHYFFSVRTTNPSVKKIINQKNAALCLVPFNSTSKMYSLGKHHKNGRIEIENLDFKIICSETFKIPIPEFSINAIELKVLENFQYGGYTVFYAQVVNFKQYSDEWPLVHTPWYSLKKLS